MSNKITAPYNFVPLNSAVYFPNWSELASHDLPLSDGEDGIIEVNIHSVSPLFTRNGDKSDQFSAHIVLPDGTRQYYIPATSIKGMLRNLVTIMSMGKMQEGSDYQNRTFGWRDVARSEDKKRQETYRKSVVRGKPGWLQKHGDRYFFTPCLGSVHERGIPVSNLSAKYPTYKTYKSVWKTNCSVKKDANGYPVYPEIKYDGSTYRVVCSGAMGDKAHEILFPIETGEPIEICKDTINSFKTMYAETPGFAEETDKGGGCFLKALEAGAEIPVFHIADYQGRPTLGMSRNFRLPYKYNVREQVECIQKLSDADAKRPDLADTIFGYTSREQSLKGRVAIGYAFMQGSVADESLILVNGILGAPKPSYHPLYLKQTNSYKTYDDNSGIAGRKLYRIHSGSTTTQLPQPGDNAKEKDDVQENENVITTFRAIPAGQTFCLRITVHNMKPVEIGALLSALTLNCTEGTFLNIGLAKGFGYGKCKVSLNDIKLQGLTHPAEHYMHEFEAEMSKFTCDKCGQKQWRDTENIKQLMSIMTEHDDATLKMMDLDGYKDCKKDFSSLTEVSKTVNTWLTSKEWDDIVAESKEREQLEKYQKTKEKLRPYFDEAEAFEKNGQWLKAQSKYLEIKGMLISYGVITDEVDKKLEEISKTIASIGTVGSTTGPKPETLAEVLDALKDGTKINTLIDKVTKWQKKKALDADDKLLIVATAERLLFSPHKDDHKELKKDYGKCKIWPRLEPIIGKEKCQQMHEKFKIGK